VVLKELWDETHVYVISRRDWGMLDSVAFFSTCFERKWRHPCSDGWNGRRSIGRPFPSSHRLTERVGNRSVERHSHRQSWRHCHGPTERNVHRSAEWDSLRSVERKDRHSAEWHSHRHAERNDQIFADSFHKLFDRRVRISLLSDVHSGPLVYWQVEEDRAHYSTLLLVYGISLSWRCARFF
jgi:hypothetical protein